MHSQSERCYQTVQVKCGDTIADYLTLKEKKNLFKLQIRLEQLHSEVEYLREAGKIDSTQIDLLNGYYSELMNNFNLFQISNDNYRKGIDAYENTIKGLRRQMRLNKVKSWAAGVAGGVGAFGAGVGVTFIILKLN